MSYKAVISKIHEELRKNPGYQKANNSVRKWDTDLNRILKRKIKQIAEKQMFNIHSHHRNATDLVLIFFSLVLPNRFFLYILQLPVLILWFA